LKYQYLYQTKENENREGWINAKNRAEAYAALRRQGIRPYRLIGDDPVQWQPWAAGVGFVVLAAIATFFAYRLFLGAGPVPGQTPARRQQLAQSAVVSDGLASGWSNVFSSKLDLLLAAYAQPGWIAIPPDVTDEELARFPEEAAAPMEFPEGEPKEVRLLRRIVLSMRQEFSEYLASGGTPKDYLAFLEERQDEELSFRRSALESVEKASPAMRERTFVNVNVRLREMGLPELAR